MKRWVVVGIIALLAISSVGYAVYQREQTPPQQPITPTVSKFPSIPVDQGSLEESTLAPTEVFFDRDSEPQMEASPFLLCDLNYDGACNEADQQIFNNAFGKCRGDPGYNFDTDIDGDGCVVTNDRQALFPLPTPTPLGK